MEENCQKRYENVKDLGGIIDLAVSSSLGSRSVQWWGRRPQNAPSKLACLALSSARSCPFSCCTGCFSTACWSHLSPFLAVWSPRGDTRGTSVVSEAFHLPFLVSLNFLTLLIISMAFFLSLNQMLVLWC